MIQRAHTIELVEIDKIVPNKKNRNNHPEEQIERLCNIIKYQGFRHPLLVSNRSGCLVSGHGRLLAARKLGMTHVPVVYQDFEDEDQEYTAGVSDNAIASWAELDLSAINTDIPELGPFDIDLLGIKDFSVEPADKYGDKDADATPETRETQIKAVDLFALGEHRLLCGDSTSSEMVQRLMNGEKADMVFTDPPYGISLDTDYSKMSEGGYKYRKVENDDKPFDASDLLSAFEYCNEVFLWGAENFRKTLPDGGCWIVWDKSTNDADDCFFANPIELCWSKQKHKYAIFRKYWRMMAAAESGEKRMHPTQKPIDMAEWFFERWGKEAKLVVDLYLGSGSTLIACEKTNRKCYGMEIDPVYCQVIIDRWEKFTGKKAEKLNG